MADQFDVNIRVGIVNQATQGLRAIETELQKVATIRPTIDTSGLSDTNINKKFAASLAKVQETIPSEFNSRFKGLTTNAKNLANILNGKGLGLGGGKTLPDMVNELAASLERLKRAAPKGELSQVAGLQKAANKLQAETGKFDQKQASYLQSITDETQRKQAEKTLTRRINAQRDVEARRQQSLLGLAPERTGGGLAGAASRVLLWGGAATAIYGGIRAIRQAISLTIDLENEMVQLQKVMSDTTDFDMLKKSLFDISETFGVAIQDITSIARIWAQQGFEVNDVLSLTNETMTAMLSLNISAGQATDYLTSVMRVWNIETQDLTANLSQLMAVQADFAINSEDLATIIQKIGAGVRAAGDDMSFLAGISTALRESTRKTSNAIATSLKSIYARAFKTDALDALEAVGVQTRLNATTFRSFSDILNDLSIKWGTLTEIQKRNVAQTVGGIRYWSDFFALLENFDIAKRAVDTFNSSWDEAVKAAALQQQSLKNQIALIGASFAELADSYGTQFFDPLVRVVSPILSAFLQVLDKLPKTALVAGAAVKFFAASFRTLVGFFPATEQAFAAMGAGVLGLTTQIQRGDISLRGLIRTISTGSARFGVLSGTVYRAQTSFALAAASGNKFRILLNGLRVAAVSTGVAIRGLLLSLRSLAITFVAIEAISFVFDKIRGVFSDTKEEVADFTDEAIKKIRSLNKVVSETGRVISPTETVETLSELTIAINKFKEESGQSVVYWNQMDKVMETMSSTSVENIREGWGDVTTELKAQQQIMKDIATTIAYIKNVALKDMLDVAEKLNSELTQGFKEGLPDLLQVQDEAAKKLRSIASRGDIASPIKVKKEDFRSLIEATNLLDKFKESLGLSGPSLSAGLQRDASQIPLDPFARNEFLQTLNSTLNLLSYAINGEWEKFTEQVIKDRNETIPGIFNLDPNLAKSEQKKFAKSITDAIAGSNKYINDFTAREGGKLFQAIQEGFFGNVQIEPAANIVNPKFYSSITEATKAINKLQEELSVLEFRFKSGLISRQEYFKGSADAYRKQVDSTVSNIAKEKSSLRSLEAEHQHLTQSILQNEHFIDEVNRANPDGRIFSDLEVLEQLRRDADRGPEAVQDAAEANKNSLSELLRLYNKNDTSIQKTTRSLQELNNVDLGDLLKQASGFDNLFFKGERDTSLRDSTVKLITASRQSLDELKAEEIKAQQALYNVRQKATLDYIDVTEQGYEKIYRFQERRLRREQQIEKDIIEIRRAGALGANLVETGNLAEKILDEPLGFANFNELFKVRQQHKNNVALINQQYDAEKAISDKVAQRVLQEQTLTNFYKVQIDYLGEVQKRTEFVRDAVAESLTDFESIQRTFGASAILDPLSKIGQKFIEGQAELFVRSVIDRDLANKLLGGDEEARFNERLTAAANVLYQSGFSGIVDGAAQAKNLLAGTEFAGGGQSPNLVDDIVRGALQKDDLETQKRNAKLFTLLNLAGNIGLGTLSRANGRPVNNDIQNAANLVTTFATGNPLLGVAGGLFAGAVSTFFGKKTERQNQVQIDQLSLIEQNTARIADLTEKLLNIRGTVFVPQGGFAPTGGISINITGVSNPEEAANMAYIRVLEALDAGSRRSGSRGNFLI